MTGYQLQSVLIVACLCAAVAVVAVATAWRYRAESQADEARELRREAEARLELARLEAATDSTAHRPDDRTRTNEDDR